MEDQLVPMAMQLFMAHTVFTEDRLNNALCSYFGNGYAREQFNDLIAILKTKLERYGMDISRSRDHLTGDIVHVLV